MKIIAKLYSSVEVGQIIVDTVHDIAGKMAADGVSTPEKKSLVMREWAEDLLPQVEDVVVEEVVRRQVQGITLSIWIGPPGSGKGTNIETVELLGKLYAEVVSQGGARLLDEPFHSLLLQFSVDRAAINTGTKGMFNRPDGEYVPLFSDLVPIIGKHVADGGFVPDDLVSVLVELMLLYRLTQNAHRIQIDLWPRTGPQFAMFSRLGQKIKQKSGKLTNEVVIIKVLDAASLQEVRTKPLEFAVESRNIAQSIKKEVESMWYVEAFEKGATIQDPQERFAIENTGLAKLFTVLEQKHTSDVCGIVLEELRTVCNRMAFRFNLIVRDNQIPRPDEYPLSIIRRLAVYTGETSPAFLEAVADSAGNSGYYVVSSAGTPEEVINDLLDTLAGVASANERWSKVKEFAGEIAVTLVHRKELIVGELLQRLGGIINS